MKFLKSVVAPIIIGYTYSPCKCYLENQQIMKLIQEIFEQSFESYGSPRMSVELSRRAYKVFRRRTARIESTRLTS